MRAVCTRGRFEGGWKQLACVCVCVCVHTHEEGRGSLFFFSPRDGGKNTSSREEALIFRREDPFFRPSANPSFVSPPFFPFLSFFFFSNRPPSFPDRARLPAGKGWKPRERERGETAALLCTAEILSQTRYYFSRYYPVRAFCSFCCCSRAIALVVR